MPHTQCIVMVMSHAGNPADVIADLFDLDVQVGPVHELPSGMDSADCTSDGCTATCAGCKQLS
jgi:hypothetical protein